MFLPATSRDRVLASTWRPGAQVRPRRARRRRVVAVLALVFVALAVGAYHYLTRPARLAAFAERRLAEAAGGDVEVGAASFGLFDGLMLGDVTLTPPGEAAPLAVVRQVRLDIDWGRLAGDGLGAVSLLAVDPRVTLRQDTATGVWNVGKLAPGGGADEGDDAPAVSSGFGELPTLVLRNAAVVHQRVTGGVAETLGEVSIDGRLRAGPSGTYELDVATRGAAAGPTLRASFDPAADSVTASLSGVMLGGEDVRAMLPAEVAAWWDRLDVSGTLDVPQVVLMLPGDTADGGFDISLRLRDATLSVPAEVLLGSDELRRRRLAAEAARDAGWLPRAWREAALGVLEPEPVRLTRLRGMVRFTPEAIRIEEVYGEVDGSPLRITGRIDGYDPASPGRLTLETPPGQTLMLRPDPDYVAAMPNQVREIWHRFRPAGRATLRFDLVRDTPGGRPEAGGTITVVDGAFRLDRLPYPVERAAGSIHVERDPATGEDRVVIAGLRGRGPAGSVNEDAVVQVNGVIQPLGRGAGFDIHVAGRDITADRRLVTALPLPVQTIFRRFDADGESARVHGDFTVHVARPPGPDRRWGIETTLDLRDSSGSFEGFAYPLQNVAGRVEIGRSAARLDELTMRRGLATVGLDGLIRWGDTDRDPGEPRVRPELRVAARNVPIDDALLGALPPAQREQLARLDPAGVFDVTGVVTTAPAAGGGVGYDLDLNVRDGSLRPTGGSFAVADATGRVRVTPRAVSFEGVTARAPAGGTLTADGVVRVEDGEARLTAEVAADDLALTDDLRADLPEAGRFAWDWLELAGVSDARLSYDGRLGGSDAAPEFRLQLDAEDVSVRPEAVPYRMSGVTGQVVVTPERVTLRDITGRHAGGATATVSGEGSRATIDGRPATVWDLSARFDGAATDEELLAALPEGLGRVARELELDGVLAAELPELRVLQFEDAEPDVTFDARLRGSDVAVNVGVGLTEAEAAIELAGRVRAGTLDEVSGTVRATDLKVAGRDAARARVDLTLDSGQEVLRMTNLSADVSGGELTGEATLSMPAEGDKRYTLDLTLVDADVAALTGDVALTAGEEPIKAVLTATLSAEGVVGRPLTRRGVGDVLVEGRDGERLVRLPVVLGLLQVVNLTLPLKDGFDDATVRYALDEETLYLERINLAAGDLSLAGDGRLNFASGEVRLTLAADNRGMRRVPFVGDLLAGTSKELLQVKVRGTLEEPEVSAGTLNTLVTTVDEVLGE